MTTQTLNDQAAEVLLKSCPFCGSKPVKELGKRGSCQLHGETYQPIVIRCKRQDCPAKPKIEGGDIYNGAEEKAVRAVSKLWNTRVNAAKDAEIAALRSDLAIEREAFEAADESDRNWEEMYLAKEKEIAALKERAKELTIRLEAIESIAEFATPDSTLYYIYRIAKGRKIDNVMVNDRLREENTTLRAQLETAKKEIEQLRSKENASN